MLVFHSICLAKAPAVMLPLRFRHWLSLAPVCTATICSRMNRFGRPRPRWKDGIRFSMSANYGWSNLSGFGQSAPCSCWASATDKDMYQYVPRPFAPECTDLAAQGLVEKLKPCPSCLRHFYSNWKCAKSAALSQRRGKRLVFTFTKLYLLFI